jgi:para-nitrobenzyl esterase
MKKMTFVFACLLTVFAACSAELTGIAEVEGGKVEGVVKDSLKIFKGIPFAAPPVGDLRWKAPQPLIPWDGIKKADNFAKGPVQGSKNPENFSEDCLYLNVWTPAKTASDKLPVMVWIYGGGFAFGSTAEASYDGEALARHGVVLVSIAYRVGMLGFLCHPELTGENPEHVSGNYGLLDQIAGLKWVKNNIVKFGGDPDNVTVFGESAGGISVSMLCASPLAKGLFRRAISQSGGSFGNVRESTYPGENMKTLAMAEKDGEKIAGNLGVKSLDELRALPAEKFAGRDMSGFGAWPVVDGYVIKDNQYKLYEKGDFNDVDILVGYNSDEGASFSWGDTFENHAQLVARRYEKFADTLLKVYPLTNEGKLNKTARDLSRDAAFGWQTWAWASLQSKVGKSKVYLYYFDQPPAGAEGSYHGQDVNFVFQRVGGGENEVALSKAMGIYWTNFAKNGNPNGAGVPEWPEFNSENQKVMYLTGPVPFAGTTPSLEAMKVLDGYFAWRRNSQ